MAQSTSPFCKFDIAESTSTLQSHPPCASRGPRLTIVHRQTDRPRRKWQATRHEEIQKGKELRLQNWAKQREHFDELSALNPEVLKALDMKECMLEVQASLMVQRG